MDLQISKKVAKPKGLKFAKQLEFGKHPAKMSIHKIFSLWYPSLKFLPWFCTRFSTPLVFTWFARMGLCWLGLPAQMHGFHHKTLGKIMIAFVLSENMVDRICNFLIGILCSCKWKPKHHYSLQLIVYVDGDSTIENSVQSLYLEMEQSCKKFWMENWLNLKIK